MEGVAVEDIKTNLAGTATEGEATSGGTTDETATNQAHPPPATSSQPISVAAGSSTEGMIAGGRRVGVAASGRLETAGGIGIPDRMKAKSSKPRWVENSSPLKLTPSKCLETCAEEEFGGSAGSTFYAAESIPTEVEDEGAPASQVTHHGHDLSLSPCDRAGSAVFLSSTSAGYSRGKRFIFEVVEGSDLLLAHTISSRVRRPSSTSKELKFTSRGGKKAEYMSHGFNTEGIRFYEEKKKMWKRLFFGIKNRYLKFGVAFDEFVQSNDWNHHYRENEVPINSECVAEEPPEVQLGNQITLSDDDDDCPWWKETEEQAEDEDGDERGNGDTNDKSEESGDEEKSEDGEESGDDEAVGDVEAAAFNGKRKGGRYLPSEVKERASRKYYLSEASGDEDEEEEEVRRPITKKSKANRVSASPTSGSGSSGESTSNQAVPNRNLSVKRKRPAVF